MQNVWPMAPVIAFMGPQNEPSGECITHFGTLLDKSEDFWIISWLGMKAKQCWIREIADKWGFSPKQIKGFIFISSLEMQILRLNSFLHFISACRSFKYLSRR